MPFWLHPLHVDGALKLAHDERTRAEKMGSTLRHVAQNSEIFKVRNVITSKFGFLLWLYGIVVIRHD